MIQFDAYVVAPVRYAMIRKMATSIEDVAAGKWVLSIGADNNATVKFEDIQVDDAVPDVCVISHFDLKLAITIDSSGAGHHGGFVKVYSIIESNDVEYFSSIARRISLTFQVVYGYLYEPRKFDVTYDVGSGIRNGIRDLYYVNYFGGELLKLIGENKIMSLSVGEKEKISDNIVCVSYTGKLKKWLFSRGNRERIRSEIGDEFFVPGSGWAKNPSVNHGDSGTIGLFGLLKIIFSSSAKVKIAIKHI